MSNVIGIDIGAQGALALLDEAGALLDVADMPILRDGPKNRANVNAPLLAEIIYRWHATQAFVEYVGARPGEGPTGAFAFGRSRGRHRRRLRRCWPARDLPDASFLEARSRHSARQGRGEGRRPFRSLAPLAR
jgi:hypothetical protein